MSAPTFQNTQTPFLTGAARGVQSQTNVGVLTLDGSHGATVGDIGTGVIGGFGNIASVFGGLNVSGTQFIQFVPSPDGKSLLSLNSSGVPTNAPADSYKISVTTFANG